MTNHDAEHYAATTGGWDWDARYSASDRIWSGQANSTLITEIAEELPGRALDVGCGEGADAVWLARHGWRVAALDVSGVAIERARQAAKDAGVDIEWIHAGLLDAHLPHGGFNLVSVQYPALPKTAGQDAERTLLALVAPSGTLLMVHHADMDAEHAKEHGFDPADYLWPTDVLAALDDTWNVQVNERRPRQVPTGGDPRHSHDLVLRASRRS